MTYIRVYMCIYIYMYVSFVKVVHMYMYVDTRKISSVRNGIRALCEVPLLYGLSTENVE